MFSRTVVVAQALMYAFTCLLFAAEPEATRPSVEVLRIKTLITVRQRITAGIDPIVVPTCGTAADRTLSLCTVDIEVKNAQGWVKAPFNPSAPVPGGYPLEQQQATTVAPGTSAEFTFTFWKAQYHVKVNESLRLRISTWPTEDAMRTGGPKHDIITGPFTFE